MTVLQSAAGNWHPLIKGETAEALPSLILPSVAAHHGGKIDWEKGDIAGQSPMSAHHQPLCRLRSCKNWYL